MKTNQKHITKKNEQLIFYRENKYKIYPLTFY